MTQTRPANCTCRGDLLPCAFCRGAAVPVPDRINEVVAALAQQPHITQPGAVAVARETPAETRAQIERYNATANANAALMRLQQARVILRTQLAAAEARIIGVEDENNQLRNAIAYTQSINDRLTADHKAMAAALAKCLAEALTGQPGTNPGAGEVVEPRVSMESLGIAFTDPDPPATPTVMPANALRTPRRDGWKMLT
jgi:septal ring factor EnvC (AmiA/AmiB activator)